MPLILVAVDESDESIAAAREARQLFGVDAEYLAVNVAEGTPAWAPTGSVWGAVYPYPYAAPYPLVEEEVSFEPTDDVEEDARQRAHDLATEAGIRAPAAIGEVGDPATAILDAASRHHADVIVVGAGRKRWWERLVEGSVTRQLTSYSRIPVLVAGQATEARAAD
jgi:nucleotide-binding universal stress UspA family protein